MSFALLKTNAAFLQNDSLKVKTIYNAPCCVCVGSCHIFIAFVTEVSNTECARRVLQRFGHRTLPPQNASLILRCKG